MNFHCEVLSDDTGAITIDFLALTSCVLLSLTMTIYAIFNTGVADLVLGMNLTLTEGTTGSTAGHVPAPSFHAGTANSALIGQETGLGTAAGRAGSQCSVTGMSNAAANSACRGG